VTIATVVFSWIFNDTSRFIGFTKDAIWSILFSANTSFALQNTDFALIGTQTSPFQHFWSLGVLVQFYIVWPVLIMVGLSLRGLKYQGKRVPWQSRFTAIFLGLGLISLAVMVVTFSEHLSSSYFLTASRLWELSAGALVAMLVRLKDSPLRASTQKLLNYAPVPLLLLSALIVRFDNFAYTLPLVVMAAAILVSKPADSTDLDVRALSVRPLRFMGNISYSLYLWHWPILIFGTQLGFADSIPGKILLLVTSFASVVIFPSLFSIDRSTGVL
jgi:peptidoglycan/LPS O-acetylase OafA/YrhL